MTSKEYEYLCWVDLETTNTDEHLDPILEFAMIVTPRDCSDILLDYTSVIQPDLTQWPDWRGRMPEVVGQMHLTSGLLQDIEGGKKGAPLSLVELHAIALLSEVGEPKDFSLAGSGVSHFDRRFLKAQMPRFEKWLHYKVNDTSIARELFRNAGREDLIPPTNESKTHRALEDIRLHLEEFKVYLSFLRNFGVPTFPTVSDYLPLHVEETK